MKFYYRDCVDGSYGRSPRGERGLKYPSLVATVGIDQSFPSRGTWIEISQN
ncbi:protein of unknown function [Ruminococcaceae bacterium BL-6]|nr:protein of unknown function [Ruminococcaceae bacterium BL-6]